MSLLDLFFRENAHAQNEASLLSSHDGSGNEIEVLIAGEFGHVALAAMVFRAGLFETDGFQQRVPWIIAGVVLLLAANFLSLPGWGAT